jgi:hypothetical protein
MRSAVRRWLTPPADRVVVPLRERKLDLFFVVAFSCFIVTSIVTDSVNGLNGALDPDSAYPVERFIYDSYARLADPLLIVNPPQVRVSAWISAFVWLPMYALFIYGFVRGVDRIRPFGLVYGGALTHGMITYMSEGIFGRVATEGWADASLCPGCVEPNTMYYLAANIAYLIVPALMIARMWKPHPFTRLRVDGDAVPATDGEVVIDLRSDEAEVSLSDQVEREPRI